MYIVVWIELLLETWTKIEHTNRHVYSINRHVHIACFDYYEFISHECFQPLILPKLRYNKMYLHARHGKPIEKKYCYKKTISNLIAM